MPAVVEQHQVPIGDVVPGSVIRSMPDLGQQQPGSASHSRESDARPTSARGATVIRRGSRSSIANGQRSRRLSSAGSRQKISTPKAVSKCACQCRPPQPIGPNSSADPRARGLRQGHYARARGGPDYFISFPASSYSRVALRAVNGPDAFVIPGRAPGLAYSVSPARAVPSISWRRRWRYFVVVCLSLTDDVGNFSVRV